MPSPCACRESKPPLHFDAWPAVEIAPAVYQLAVALTILLCTRTSRKG